MRAFPYERIMRDTRIMMIFEGTNEILRMYIALTGMQYAGKKLSHLVKALKNPLANRGVLAETILKRVKYSVGMKGNINISDFVHPTLKKSATKLEENVVDFGVMSEKLLRKYKKNIVDQQLLLKRLSNVIINIFGMTAVLSRATRTMAKEDLNADYEVLLANTFCQEAYHRNKTALGEIKKGTLRNGDSNLEKIAAGVFERNSQVPRHPLSL
ncbi:Acyl- dehydrogenase family member 9, mitochondrial [Paramuricea clavata]|uniref:Acyl- dehydrogenase family member 9, mitochondrial n=1 Tax=Paramuricea clavata TaxID=317549 RepID=A0A7D9DW36_PARCT|nr:Acyl- dehydrogenase family member 9, mitochondrial [Paramuricea clavata]